MLITWASQQRISSEPSYGPELVTNGDFSSAAGWTLTGTPPPGIFGGKLHGDPFEDPLDDGFATTTAASSLVAAALYRCVYTIDSLTISSVRIIIGGALGTLRSSPGTYTQNIAAGALQTIRFQFISPCNAVIDNVSVKRIL